jgi:hypothetical protein
MAAQIVVLSSRPTEGLADVLLGAGRHDVTLPIRPLLVWLSHDVQQLFEGQELVALDGGIECRFYEMVAWNEPAASGLLRDTELREQAVCSLGARTRNLCSVEQRSHTDSAFPITSPLRWYT